MGMEIERRWLSLGGLVLPDSMAAVWDYLEQGYVETGSPLAALRYRIVDGLTGIMTVKTGTGMERPEYEGTVTPMDAVRAVMDICHHRLEKSRHPKGPWAVDFFRSPLAGIVIVEFEHKDRDTVLAARPLPWMGNLVEVTDSLSNLHLARMATDLKGSGMDPLATVLARIQAPHIPKVVIDGGPGSGKSTMMALLRQWYPDLQFVPEVATIVIAQVGITPGGDSISGKSFQRTIVRIQKIFEMTSAEFAAATGKRALVLDRGFVSNAAYTRGGLQELVSTFQTTVAAEYANYDLVLDLAVPPQDVYEKIKGNNAARRETYKDAAWLGDRIALAWAGHPRHVLIGNDDGWDGKIATVRRELDRLLL